MNLKQKMSFVLISIILLSATAFAAPATDHTKATVIEVPVAAFLASPASGDAPLEVQFTDESTGTPTSWKWSFGDGKFSTDKNPVHTYSKAGKYTVSLTVKNAGGTDKIRKHNYITVYTATTPDKEVPVINSVILSSTVPETGNLITVTVDVTDNVGVSSITASGVSLVNTGGNIWEGSIVAEEGTHSVSVTASDAAGNSAVDESASYTATTSDKTAPVINSVILSTTAPETGNLITVTVDVTDNVGVSSVTASGVSLVDTGGNIWKGDITAIEGTNTISVTASDAAGNSAIDELASYTATTTSTAVDSVCHMTVNKSTAKYTSVYNGTTYYFCSSYCKAKFDANPENYINS